MTDVSSASRRMSLIGRLPTALLRKAAGEAMRRADWATAAKLWKRVLDLAPGMADIWVQFGHALKEQGEYGKAEAAYREALRLDPRNADTHLQLGHLLKIVGRRDEAADAYLVSSGLSPDGSHAAFELREMREHGASASAIRHAHGARPADVVPASMGDYWSSGPRPPNAVGPLGVLYGELRDAIGTASVAGGWVSEISGGTIIGLLPRERVEGGGSIAVTVNDDAPSELKPNAVTVRDGALGRSELVPFRFQEKRLTAGREANKVVLQFDGLPVSPTPVYVFSEGMRRQVSQIDAAGLQLSNVLQSALFR